MLTDTRQSLHFGVNFIVAPRPLLDGRHLRDFQDALAGEGIEFTVTNVNPPQGGVFHRPGPRPLEVRVFLPAPEAPVAQLLALAPQPARTLEEFADEARAVCEAFSATWPGQRQILTRDCTVRHLYDVAAEHAFQYLWEQRLGIPETQLQAFGRPVLGGGLRFVMPPTPGDPEPRQIEVKIESYLADSRKLYVDVAFAWPTPRPQQAKFTPAEMLDEVEAFAVGEVVAFITGGANDSR